MSRRPTSHIVHGLVRGGVAMLFAAYFVLVALKSPFEFNNPEYEGAVTGPALVQVVVENEPAGHLRTGSACLLMGLLIGAVVKMQSARERARQGIVTLIASAVLMASTFLGTSALAIQPILLLIALYGVFVSIGALRASST